MSSCARQTARALGAADCRTGMHGGCVRVSVRRHCHDYLCCPPIGARDCGGCSVGEDVRHGLFAQLGIVERPFAVVWLREEGGRCVAGELLLRTRPSGSRGRKAVGSLVVVCVKMTARGGLAMVMGYARIWRLRGWGVVSLGGAMRLVVRGTTGVAPRLANRGGSLLMWVRGSGGRVLHRLSEIGRAHV